MSSEEENYIEPPTKISEELTIILANEEFPQLFAFLLKLSQEDLQRSKLSFQHSLKFLIANTHYSQALDLLSSFPYLQEHPWPPAPLIKKLFNIIKGGEIADLEHFISFFGFYPGITSADGYNLFTEAVCADQYLMLKYIREELGVECKDEKNLVYAARIGNKAMLKYLYEEIGVEILNPDQLVKSAVNANALDCIEYIRFYMNVAKISDYKIMSSAINQAVLSHSTEILNYLISNFSIEFEPAHIPPTRQNGSKKTSLFSSLYKLVVHNDIGLMNYLLHVVKLELSTDVSESEMNCYLELLQICVKKGYVEMLKVLVDDAQLQVSLLPKVNEDELMVTVIGTAHDSELKIRMLEVLKKFDNSVDYDETIKKIQHEAGQDGNGAPYKKIKSDINSYS